MLGKGKEGEPKGSVGCRAYVPMEDIPGGARERYQWAAGAQGED